MPLKVLDAAVRGRTTGLAEAIGYAIKHGARVINLSLGGEGISRSERLAIDTAHRHGIVVVVAAGNAAGDTAGYGPAGLSSAITVGATDPQDRSPTFSNHGTAVKLAAPGVEILSLRARRTDLTLGFPGYTPGAHVVGPRARYYRANGTSFAAPFVSGTASLLLARNPALTNVQVERMLVMSADDLDPPGWDRYTGAGRLNARRALEADPGWFLQARLTAVEPAEEKGGPVLRVLGAAVGPGLREYTIELGRGEAPSRWTRVGRGERAVEDGLLGVVPAKAIREAGTWTLRVVARDSRGTRESRTTLAIE
jgi:subtilisin family serine protease